MAQSLEAHFRAQACNNAWSNARLLDACQRLTDAAFAAKRVSFFPSLRATLNHILIVQRYYLTNLRGRDRVFVTDQEPYRIAADLAAAQEAADRDLIAFCDASEAPDLDRTVAIRFTEGGGSTERVSDVLAHLFVHQIHHRGQAHAMLAGTDVAPPQLDEFFLAFDAPRREADLRRLDLPAG